MDTNNEKNDLTTQTQINDEIIDDKNSVSSNNAVDAEKSVNGKKKKRSFALDKKRSEFPAQFFAIVVTALIRAVSINVFANPNKISQGGVTGIGTILYNALGWNISLSTLIMNIPLLVLAFFFINKRFALLTLLNTVVTSIFLQFIPMPQFTENTFVAALMSGILSGIATGILLRVNCSTGGTDIIGLLIQNKFPNAKVVWIIFILNVLTGVAAGLVFGSLEIVIYSVICLVSSTYAADLLQRGMLSTFEVKIITSKTAEISDYILNDLHRGVSLMKTKGMYTGVEHDYIVCIIRKRQLADVKKAVIEIDPNCFMYITSVYDTIGKGFDNTVTPKSKFK